MFNDWSTMKKLIWLRGSGIGGGSSPQYETVTGKIVSFLTQRAAPLKIEADLEPIQDLNGQDAPYPAGGGKNVLPFTLANCKAFNTEGTWNGNVYTRNDLTFTVVEQDGNAVSVIANGTPSESSDFIIYSSLVLPSGSYVLNGCPTGGSSTTYRVFATNYGGDTGTGLTINANGTQATTVRINIKAAVSNKEFKPMIRLASVTDASFAPYENICPISGHSGADIYVEDEYDAQADPTVQISFGSTVYGGTLTVNEDGTWMVMADSGLTTINGGFSAAGNGVFYKENAIPTGKNAMTTCNKFLSNVYPTLKDAVNGTPAMKTNAGKLCFQNSTNLDSIRLGVYDTSFASVDDFNTYLSNNNLQVIFELATPITISLSPGQVNALLGNNTVWVSSTDGDSPTIKVTYRSN